MAVVRIKNKKVFDDIQAQLILRLDRKITQQETLELFVKLGSQNIEQL